MKYAAVVILIDPTTGYYLGATRRDSIEFGLIGGKKDGTESLRNTALREFKEEVGIELEHEINYLGSMQDGEYNVAIYHVFHTSDVYRVVKWIGYLGKIVEPGIYVNFVPFRKLLSGPFREFNENLIDVFSKYITTHFPRHE